MPDDIVKIADDFRKALLQKERNAAVRLVNAYGLAWCRIEKELAKLTAQIADARAKGETVNQFWLARQERYFALLQQTGAEMAKFADIAEVTITKQQAAAVKAGLGDSVELMDAAAGSAGVRTTFNRLPVATVENMVGFLGDGSPLRSLLNQLPRAGRAIVEQGLIEGVALGRNPKAIARQIREGLGGNMVRALTIARTETLRAYRQASIQNYRQNQDLISGYYWRSSRSRRSCAACIALDGTFYPLTQPMRNHPRCRCVMLPGLKDLNVDRGADWFAKQPPEVQRDILGTDKGYELYKRGELNLEDFVGLKRDPRWGDTYHQLSVKRAIAGEAQFPAQTPRPPGVPPVIPLGPSPAPQLQPQPTGKPVRDGLKLPARGKLAQAGKTTLDAIAQIHGDGNLPQIPVELERSRNRHGAFWYRTGPVSSTATRITARTQGHPELTLAHEIGHFLDQQGAGQGKFASLSDPLFDEFRQVAKNSQAIRDIESYLSTGKAPAVSRDSSLTDLRIDSHYARYLLTTEEVWARSYAQYVAVRSSDMTLMKQLNDLRSERLQQYYPSQWTDDDFKPIAEAIDRLMIALGWRQ